MGQGDLFHGPGGQGMTFVMDGKDCGIIVGGLHPCVRHVPFTRSDPSSQHMY